MLSGGISAATVGCVVWPNELRMPFPVASHECCQSEVSCFADDGLGFECDWPIDVTGLIERCAAVEPCTGRVASGDGGR